MSRLRAEFHQAVRNLKRNARRSAVTGSAILAGFVGLALLAGYVARVERFLLVNTVYLNNTGHVAIYKADGLDRYFSRPSKFLLSPDNIRDIQDVLDAFPDDVEFTAPYLMANGLLQSGEASFPFQGKGLTKEADRFTRQHPMVTRWTSELLGNEQGQALYESKDPTPLKLTFKLAHMLRDSKDVQLQGLTVDQGFNALEGKVVSRYSTGLDLMEDTSMLTTLPVFQELMATDGVTYLGVYLKNDAKTRWLAFRINRAFAAKGLKYEAHPFTDERIGLFYTGTMNFLYAMASFFFFLVSLVVILSIANAISMNIIERSKELGTMRAIGYTPKDISRLMAVEGLVLAFVSIAVGFVVCQLIAGAVNAANIRFFPPGIAGDMQFVLTPWPSICLGLAVPLAFLACATSYFVTAHKMKGEVIKLLTETTT